MGTKCVAWLAASSNGFGVVCCAVLWHAVLQAMWGFARMEYRPPNQLLDAVLKVGKGQATNGGAVRCGRVCGECEGIPGGTVCAGGVLLLAKL
jgi:hypothetical protein